MSILYIISAKSCQ